MLLLAVVVATAVAVATPSASAKPDSTGGHKTTKVPPLGEVLKLHTIKAVKAVITRWTRGGDGSSADGFLPPSITNPGLGDQWGPFLGGDSGLGGQECYGENGSGGTVIIADPCWLLVPEDEQEKTHKMVSVNTSGTVDMVVPESHAPAMVPTLSWGGTVPALCMSNVGVYGDNATIYNVPCGATGGAEDFLVRSYDNVTTNLLAWHSSEECLTSWDGYNIVQFDCQSSESGAMSWDARQLWIQIDAGGGRHMYVNQAYQTCLTLTPDYWQPVHLVPCYTGPQNVLR